jgi:carbon-monoxide dehydrogenase iron sulfur subunit
MAVCPSAAIQRSADYPDIVVIDAHKCISCGMCAMVCPFDVITYYPLAAAPERQSVAVKCDHCIERQREGLVPACVEACKVKALEFGEINELAKAARTHYSETVSIAIGEVGRETALIPENVEAWRGFGAAVTHLKKNGKRGA